MGRKDSPTITSRFGGGSMSNLADPTTVSADTLINFWNFYDTFFIGGRSGLGTAYL